MIKISLQNSGGELDKREVEAPCDVREAIIEMISQVEEFYHGDKIVITDTDEE